MFVRREFRGESQAGRQGPPPPEFRSDWLDLASGGVRVGRPDARITILEFADLECPACRRFQSTLRLVRNRFPDDISVVFVHFPLPQHRFARKAAQAAECADEQGRFAEFIELTFEQQDSLGLKSWASFGREAGVPDSKRFEKCVGRLPSPSRIDTGIALATRIRATGTPTVIVNGWRYYGTPREDELVRVITSLLARRAPFDRTGKPTS
jgi:protein-disulfide isomerase